jgi:hypothetical protein
MLGCPSHNRANFRWDWFWFVFVEILLNASHLHRRDRARRPTISPDPATLRECIAALLHDTTKKRKKLWRSGEIEESNVRHVQHRRVNPCNVS